MRLSASQQRCRVGASPPYQSRIVDAAVAATRKVPGGRINSVLAHRRPPSRGEQGVPPSDDSSAPRASLVHVRERRASPAKPSISNPSVSGSGQALQIFSRRKASQNETGSQER